MIQKRLVKYVPQTKTFRLNGHHSTMSPEELSERSHIGIEQARDKIAKTTKILTRSAIRPISRRYKARRVFKTNRLTGMWST